MMRIPWKTIMLGLLWLLPKTGGCFFEPPTVPQAWYWVTFTDKAGTAGSLERPAELLSPRALARRARLGIPIDSLDLPVSTRYLRRLRQEGAFILHTSRWLNAATVRLAKARAEEIGRLPFVGSVVRVAPWKSDMMEVKAVGELVAPGDAQPDVAPPNSGLSMLGGDSLHALGWKGQGMPSLK